MSNRMTDEVARLKDGWAAEREAEQQASDAHLLAAAKGGHSGAFGELFNRYKLRIFRLTQRMMRNREDAEDVVQEAFLLAFVHLPDFQGDARFSTWLSRIAINAALMKLRKRVRRVEISIDEPSESDGFRIRDMVTDLRPNPEQDCIRNERSRILREALAALGPNARRVLELYELEGRSAKEIADHMGISVSAVKARIFHARPKVRRKVDRYFTKRPERQVRLRFGTSGRWESSGLEICTSLSRGMDGHARG